MNRINTRWLDALQADMPEAVTVRISGHSMAPTFHDGDMASIHPVNVDDLHLGEYIFFRYGERAFLHRYLGKRGQTVLTKGDGNRIFDNPVTFDQILGRVDKVWRGEEIRYEHSRDWRGQRWAGRWHYMIGKMVAIKQSVKRWLTGLFLVLITLIAVTAAYASVGFVDFDGYAGENEIHLYWETASETGNVGYYVLRSTSHDSGYERITVVDVFYDEETDFIISAGSSGGYYEVMDTDVEEGILYWYKIEDVPEGGTQGDFEGPKAFGINVPTPSPEPPATATNTPIPTSTPVPNVLFWVDPETIAAGDCATVQWQASNVESVYFNGVPVGGIGAQTFCPCEDQTFELIIYFLDKTSKRYDVTLETTGECSEQHSVVPTPTPPALTNTPIPIVIPENSANATPTRMIPATPTPSPTSTRTPVPDTLAEDDLTVTPSATPQPTLRAELDDDGINRYVIDAGEEEPGVTRIIWIVLASLAGIGSVGGGIWLWRKNQ